MSCYVVRLQFLNFDFALQDQVFSNLLTTQPLESAALHPTQVYCVCVCVCNREMTACLHHTPLRSGNTSARCRYYLTITIKIEIN